MKKIHILIPSLMATASMPLIGLVGCGDEKSPIADQTIHLDCYDDEDYYLYSSDFLPSKFENNKTYCFKADLSVIDSDHDTFFDNKGWLFDFYFLGGSIEWSKVEISIFINGIKQTKHNKPTSSTGFDGYCLVYDNTDLYVCSYHKNTPPHKDDIIDVYLHFKYDTNTELNILTFEKNNIESNG